MNDLINISYFWYEMVLYSKPDTAKGIWRDVERALNGIGHKPKEYIHI
jgi:hypothetical protein